MTQSEFQAALAKLQTALKNVVTEAELETALTYVVTAELETALTTVLANVVTEAELETALTNVVIQAQLQRAFTTNPQAQCLKCADLAILQGLNTVTTSPPQPVTTFHREKHQRI